MTTMRRRTGDAFAQTSVKPHGPGRDTEKARAMRIAVPMRRSLEGALVLVAAMHGCRDANAYCRTSSKTPTNWDEATQGCHVGDAESKLLYWRNACVGYNLQQDASRQVSLDQATAIAASAFAGWHDVSCADGRVPSMHAVDLGPVACGEVRYNKNNANQNVIVFRDDVWPHADPISTLGLTTVTYDIFTGELLGADLEINSTLPLIVQATQQGKSDDTRSATGTTETPVGYDLATIVAHETGHFLGLAHSAFATAMMAAHYSEGARMSDDDIAGICAAYPSDGTRPTSQGVLDAVACNSNPPHGFSSQCAGPSTDPPPDDDSDGGCAVSRLPPSKSASIATLWAAMLGLCILRFSRRRR
jgi:hypothetical protein